MITIVIVIATILSLITITVLEILFCTFLPPTPSRTITDPFMFSTVTTLLIALTGALFLALILSPALLGTYLALMLFIQVRSDGRAGASSKTKMQFMPLAPRKKKEVVDDDLPKDEE